MLSREPDLNMTNSEAPNTFQILNLFTNFSVQFSFRFCLLELSSPHPFASIVEIGIGGFGNRCLAAFLNVLFKAEFLLPDRLADFSCLSNIAFTFIKVAVFYQFISIDGWIFIQVVACYNNKLNLFSSNRPQQLSNQKPLARPPAAGLTSASTRNRQVLLVI